MGATFEQQQRGSAVLYGACGGIWVMMLFAKPTAKDMYLARPSLQAMHQKHPNGFPTLTWVLPQAGISMDSDARNAASEVTKEFNASIFAMATLIEGEGFQAAAVRAIIAGIDFMSRAAAPKRVFAELSPGVAWCVSLRPPSERNAGTASDLVGALAAIRKPFDRTG